MTGKLREGVVSRGESMRYPFFYFLMNISVLKNLNHWAWNMGCKPPVN